VGDKEGKRREIWSGVSETSLGVGRGRSGLVTGEGCSTYVVDLNDCVIVVLGQYQRTVHGLVNKSPGKGVCVMMMMMRGCLLTRRKA
jgi:hypothetical protein